MLPAELEAVLPQGEDAVVAWNAAELEAAPTLNDMPVRAYVQAEVRTDDGRVVGALCGLNRSPANAKAARRHPLIKAFASILGGLARGDRGNAASDVGRSSDAFRVWIERLGALPTERTACAVLAELPSSPPLADPTLNDNAMLAERVLGKLGFGCPS